MHHGIYVDSAIISNVLQFYEKKSPLKQKFRKHFAIQKIYSSQKKIKQ